MSNSDDDVETAITVLSDLFPKFEALDPETMSVVASGGSVTTAKNPESASWDLTDLLREVHEWAPIVAAMITSAKALYDIRKPNPPSAEDILTEFERRQAVDESARPKLKKAASAIKRKFDERKSRR